MKRKIYATARERKVDQLIGFVAFPLVNITLWFATNQLLAWAEVTYRHSPYYDQFWTIILWQPWIVNGTLLALATIFRPQMGIGYIVCLGVVIVAGIALGVLFLASCSVAIVVGEWVNSLAPSLEETALVLTLVFFGFLMLGGLTFLGWAAVGLAKKWWSSDEEMPGGAESEEDRSTLASPTEGDGEE